MSSNVVLSISKMCCWILRSRDVRNFDNFFMKEDMVSNSSILILHTIYLIFLNHFSLAGILLCCQCIDFAATNVSYQNIQSLCVVNNIQQYNRKRILQEWRLFAWFLCYATISPKPWRLPHMDKDHRMVLTSSTCGIQIRKYFLKQILMGWYHLCWILYWFSLKATLFEFFVTGDSFFCQSCIGIPCLISSSHATHFYLPLILVLILYLKYMLLDPSVQSIFWPKFCLYYWFQ